MRCQDKGSLILQYNNAYLTLPASSESSEREQDDGYLRAKSEGETYHVIRGEANSGTNRGNKMLTTGACWVGILTKKKKKKSASAASSSEVP